LCLSADSPFFFVSSRRRHTRFSRDWSSDVCSSDLPRNVGQVPIYRARRNTGRPPAEDNRFSSKYLDVHWTPLYPFGHGLSYTRRSEARRVGKEGRAYGVS